MKTFILCDGFGFLVIIGILIYMIPSINGWNKKHVTSIVWINLLLGWTVLGWIGALIWSFNSPLDEKYMPNKYQCAKCGLIKGFKQPLKMMKCPQCGHESYYE